MCVSMVGTPRVSHAYGSSCGIELHVLVADLTCYDYSPSMISISAGYIVLSSVIRVRTVCLK